ncbi:hypothetical protein BD779DRAFT_1435384, partial [Infundibulicybe gibba]
VFRPEALCKDLEKKPQVVYAGVDPTAKSLHIGHLIPLMTLLHFHIRGHTIIPLIGGATGLVGDPSGRLTERQPADVQQIQNNVTGLTASIDLFFERARKYATTRLSLGKEISDIRVKSNLDWHGSLTMLEFLQKVGIHSRVNTMLNRESVRARLDSQQGLSFTEFTYQLLQAYDFYHLHKHHDCTIQVGGSDQWGNILAGMELISRLDQSSGKNRAEAYGLTTPLLTTSTGEKFGKSAGNAVWLDANMTSVFDFYQYFLKVTDADVEKHLKLFTLLSEAQINKTLVAHKGQPEKRIAQRCLASEITEMVHTSDGVRQAETLTRLLFESDYAGLKTNQVVTAMENDSRLAIIEEQEIFGTPITKLASKYGLVSSTSAARSLCLSRGLYLNNEAVTDPHLRIVSSDLIDKRVLSSGRARTSCWFWSQSRVLCIFGNRLLEKYSNPTLIIINPLEWRYTVF